MSGHVIYLRVKRKNQTYFFLCDDSDTILEVKRSVLRAATQHNDDSDDTKKSGAVDLPSRPDALQLLLPPGMQQQAPQGDQDEEDDGDDEMMDDDGATKKRSAFLKDDDTLGTVRGMMKNASQQQGSDESEMVLHVVFPIADNEWEPVDVVPTVMQDAA